MLVHLDTILHASTFKYSFLQESVIKYSFVCHTFKFSCTYLYKIEHLIIVLNNI